MGLDEASWVTLPRTGERLNALTYLGNGKDADLEFAFAGGTRMKLAVRDLRVETDRGVIVSTTAWDDASLKIAYTGADVYLRHGRIGLTDDEPWRAEFLDAAREWLDAGGGDDLGFVVSAELTLVSATGVAQPA